MGSEIRGPDIVNFNKDELESFHFGRTRITSRSVKQVRKIPAAEKSDVRTSFSSSILSS